MSNAVRNTVLATALVAATGLSFAARQGSNAPLTNPLAVERARRRRAHPGLHGHGAGEGHQQQQRDRQGPYWQLPGATPRSKMFQVLRDGKPVDYTGKIVKRGAPTEADWSPSSRTRPRSSTSTSPTPRT
jgi:peptidyl-Lys metalloendopeptidase